MFWLRKRKVGTCAYCGEPVYKGEIARRIQAGDSFGYVHSRCWESYVNLALPNRLVRAGEERDHAREGD